MTTRMLINATAQEELRIATVEDGELIELDIEGAERSSIRGNIYKGRVHNVEGSLAAAFVDIGKHKQAFLPFSEIREEAYYRKWDRDGRPDITDVVKAGQDILVQVAKDAIGEKGATLTTYLSIPGRYTVLMPGRDVEGVSRKIEDDKVRRKIRMVARTVEKPDDCGFIIRSAGLGQTKVAIQKDLSSLVSVLDKILKAFDIARAPSIVHAELDLMARTLRDYYSDEIDEVLIDRREEFEVASRYFKDVMPEFEDRLQHYQNPIPIFAYHHVEEQIEETFERQVSMPSGGSIVIDETEALVAIDVNSGRTSEGSHEETVFKTNAEAAEAICRQLKLRDLGGIVVIDFIDMVEVKHKREIERLLAEYAKEDKARYKISRINSKGLMILTRQRIRQGMRRVFQRRCPVCTGTGYLRTPESHSISLLRRIETRIAQGGVGRVEVATHRNTAEFLLNFRRKELTNLEQNYGCQVVVKARAEMDRGADDCVYLSHGEVLAEITDKLPPREKRQTRKPKKRRRKKKETAKSAEAKAGDSGRKKKTRSKSPGRAEDGAKGRFDGTGAATFTGKPPPEVLERLKADRKARMERLKKSRSGGQEGAGSVPKEAPADDRSRMALPETSKLASQSEASRSSGRTSTFLDRLFGSKPSE